VPLVGVLPGLIWSLLVNIAKQFLSNKTMLEKPQ
jgi:hypothetical protein